MKIICGNSFWYSPRNIIMTPKGRTRENGTLTIVPNCDASSLETHMKGVREVFVLFCLTSVITVHVLLETVAWKAYITTEIQSITI